MANKAFDKQIFLSTKILPTDIWSKDIWPKRHLAKTLFEQETTDIFPADIFSNKHFTNKHFTNRHLAQKTFGQNNTWLTCLTSSHLVINSGQVHLHVVSVDKMAVSQMVLDQKTSNHITGRIAEKMHRRRRCKIIYSCNLLL
jgi:hypothetical protein